MLLALSLRSSLTETEPPFVGAERVVLSFLFLISPARGPRRRYAVYTRRTRAAPVSARTVAREQFFSPHNFISCATTCRVKRYRLNTCSLNTLPIHQCGAGEGDGFPGADMYRSSYIHSGFRHGWGWTSTQVPYAFEHSNG